MLGFTIPQRCLGALLDRKLDFKAHTTMVGQSVMAKARKKRYRSTAKPQHTRAS